MKLLHKRGQSMGEYAILFAIVLGAVVAMQNYIKTRISAKIQAATGLYTAAGSASGLNALTLTMNVTTDSKSTTSAGMTNVRAGTLRSDSNATSTSVSN